MAWDFPEEGEFELECSIGVLAGCRMVTLDAGHITVNHIGSLGVRVETQIPLDSIDRLSRVVPVDYTLRKRLG